jgi:hypothetical protein
MTGALLQLVTNSGDYQDKWLNDEHGITFHKLVSRRHSPFSTEFIELNFNSEVDFGKSSNIKILKRGDLVCNLFFVTTIPKLQTYFPSSKTSDVTRYLTTIAAPLLKIIGVAINTWDLQFKPNLGERDYDNNIDIIKFMSMLEQKKNYYMVNTNRHARIITSYTSSSNIDDNIDIYNNYNIINTILNIFDEYSLFYHYLDRIKNTSVEYPIIPDDYVITSNIINYFSEFIDPLRTLLLQHYSKYINRNIYYKRNGPTYIKNDSPSPNPSPNPSPTDIDDSYKTIVNDYTILINVIDTLIETIPFFSQKVFFSSGNTITPYCSYYYDINFRKKFKDKLLTNLSTVTSLSNTISKLFDKTVDDLETDINYLFNYYGTLFSNKTNLYYKGSSKQTNIYCYYISESDAIGNTVESPMLMNGNIWYFYFFSYLNSIDSKTFSEMYHRSGYVFTNLLSNFIKLLKINIDYYMNEISYLANDLYRTDKTRYDDISTETNNSYFYYTFVFYRSHLPSIYEIFVYIMNCIDSCTIEKINKYFDQSLTIDNKYFEKARIIVKTLYGEIYNYFLDRCNNHKINIYYNTPLFNITISDDLQQNIKSYVNNFISKNKNVDQMEFYFIVENLYISAINNLYNSMLSSKPNIFSLDRSKITAKEYYSLTNYDRWTGLDYLSTAYDSRFYGRTKDKIDIFYPLPNTNPYGVNPKYYDNRISCYKKNKIKIGNIIYNKSNQNKTYVYDQLTSVVNLYDASHQIDFYRLNHNLLDTSYLIPTKYPNYAGLSELNLGYIETKIKILVSHKKKIINDYARYTSERETLDNYPEKIFNNITCSDYLNELYVNFYTELNTNTVDVILPDKKLDNLAILSNYTIIDNIKINILKKIFNGDKISNLSTLIMLAKENIISNNKKLDAIEKIILGVSMILTRGSNAKNAWIKYLGHFLVEQIKLCGSDINSDEIHTSDWFQVYNSISMTPEKKNGYDKLIGNIPSLTRFCYNKEKYTLYIPLLFYFNKNRSLAYPLISTTNTDLEINIKIRNLEDLCYKELYSDFLVKPVLENSYIMAEYIFLGTDERKIYLNSKLDYLIDEVQWSETCANNNNMTNIYKLSDSNYIEENILESSELITKIVPDTTIKIIEKTNKNGLVQYISTYNKTDESYIHSKRIKIRNTFVNPSKYYASIIKLDIHTDPNLRTDSDDYFYGEKQWANYNMLPYYNHEKLKKYQIKLYYDLYIDCLDNDNSDSGLISILNNLLLNTNNSYDTKLLKYVQDMKDQYMSNNMALQLSLPAHINIFAYDLSNNLTINKIYSKQIINNVIKKIYNKLGLAAPLIDIVTDKISAIINILVDIIDTSIDKHYLLSIINKEFENYRKSCAMYCIILFCKTFPMMNVTNYDYHTYINLLSKISDPIVESVNISYDVNISANSELNPAISNFDLVYKLLIFSDKDLEAIYFGSINLEKMFVISSYITGVSAQIINNRLYNYDSNTLLVSNPIINPMKYGALYFDRINILPRESSSNIWTAIQTYYYYKNSPSNSIGLYTWALDPLSSNVATGSCNLSIISNFSSEFDIDESIEKAKIIQFVVNLNIVRHFCGEKIKIW